MTSLACLARLVRMNLSFVSSKIIMTKERLAALEAIVLRLKPEFDISCKVIHPLYQYVIVHAFAVERIPRPDPPVYHRYRWRYFL